MKSSYRQVHFISVHDGIGVYLREIVYKAQQSEFRSHGSYASGFTWNQTAAESVKDIMLKYKNGWAFSPTVSAKINLCV